MDLTGLNAVLYRDQVHTDPAANPDPATLVKNYRKLKLNREKLVGNNSRHSCKTQSSKPTMQKAAIEFEMVNNDTDADVIAFQAAFDTDRRCASCAWTRPTAAALRATGMSSSSNATKMRRKSR